MLIVDDEFKNLKKHITDSNVGSRKRRNIWDQIFVINAVLNSIRKGNKESCQKNSIWQREVFWCSMGSEMYVNSLQKWPSKWQTSFTVWKKQNKNQELL